MAPPCARDGSTSGRSCKTLAELARVPRVIVIGSGFAGLGAARTLVDAGIDVLLLESRDRIGGRAHTDYSLGFPVDLGAAWLHGASLKNPLGPLVGRLRLPLYKTSDDNSVLYDHDLESFALFAADGQRVPHDVVVKVERVFEEMLQETNRLWGVADMPEDMPMKDALGLALQRRPELRLEGVEADVLQWYLCRMEGWFATDSHNLSARNWGEEKLVDGGHGLMITGYLPVLKELAKNVQILFNQRVTSVQHSTQGAHVMTSSGMSLSADAVIVTVPIGVLKAGTISFNPAIPRPKQQAIEAMGAGMENKVALLFDSVFWPSVEFLGVVGPTPYECCYFLNLHKATGAPVLVFMPAGSMAQDLEKLSDEHNVAFAMKQLRTVVPLAPQPLKSVVTRWCTDPSSLCAYSFDAVGVPMSAHDDLRASVGSSLFFAGEATSRDYPGTVHGAFSTGTEAARDCWAALNRKGLLAQDSMLEATPAASALLGAKDAVPIIMSRL